jgi:hypothetical protein
MARTNYSFKKYQKELEKKKKQEEKREKKLAKKEELNAQNGSTDIESQDKNEDE